jgi:hypothetical protein
MAQQNNKPKGISLVEDSGDVTVKVNGVRVEVHTDGSIDAYTDHAVKVHPAANDIGEVAAPASSEPKPGDKMPDGTVFAGISPDTNKPMYATPADASLTMTFNDAQKYAAQLDAHGHKDWRVPTNAELNVLFNNRAAIGGLDISGSLPSGCYWSSSQNDKWLAWGQRFSDGLQYTTTKHDPSSVRPVR